MPRAELRRAVRGFVQQNYYVPDLRSLADDTSLLGMGIVDSTGVLELVTFLEDLLQVTIEDDEIVPENLDTVDAIIAFAERKRGVGEPTPRTAGGQR